jgi:aminoglycoside phosphotransferase (APT) family kinase protein
VTIDIVETRDQAETVDPPPLVILDAVAAFLDQQGLGAGATTATRLGEGHSNATFLVERDGCRLVLRRAPRPPLPPSAHDMLREARIVSALHAAGVRVPRVVAVCDDPGLLGVPFYLMEPVDGAVLTTGMPPAIDTPAQRRLVSEDAVDALVEVHAVDPAACGLADLGRPTGYLERQVRRFAGLWPINQTRDVPEIESVATVLAERASRQGSVTIVHGDYRLGNLIVSRAAPAAVTAIVDWELATLGDPLADLGYLCVTWSEIGSDALPIELSPVTTGDGFLTRDELVGRYEQRSGRSAGDQDFYRALALFKAAVFCEAIYGRYRRGETREPFAASLGDGVPAMARAALALLRGRSDAT